MDAAILTIGEEILIGQIVDTNSSWMATELNAIGVNVRTILSIGDTKREIQNAVKLLCNQHQVVLVTGGLGPTNDDVTKLALCELFDAQMVVHQPTLEHITQMFSNRGMPLTDLNAKQAEVPNNCRVLYNPKGTAPAMLFEHEDKLLISMPGVPFEMKAIMEQHVIPVISSRSNGRVVYHKSIQTFGLPESFLAERIASWEANLPKHIALAYLPSPYSIRLRLSGIGSNVDLLKEEVQRLIEQLHTIIPEHIFGYDDDSMAKVVGDLLMDRNATVSLAESCTGGTIAQLITSNSGSSAYFMGGVVAYANQAKENLLNVPAKALQKHGAVSQQVVEAMAANARKIFGSDYAIATSGIAGPTGGTEEKPVGTIWIGIATPGGVFSRMLSFGSDRKRNVIRSSVTALNLLRLYLLEKKM